ncbi:uncharacterized protein BDV14DRAFT_199768 [Aspergillus stella-maris]|uniref:uncharacterized protein n=1 Tax=Aspergillus stella-maris TaxID=1810926 RepID=UPI003CCD72E6
MPSEQMDIHITPLNYPTVKHLWIVIAGNPKSPEATYTYIFQALEENGIRDHRCLKYVDGGQYRSLTRSLLKQYPPIKFATIAPNQCHRVPEMMEKSRVSLMNLKAEWPRAFAEYLYCEDLVEDDVDAGVLKKVVKFGEPSEDAPRGVKEIMMKALRADLEETA